MIRLTVPSLEKDDLQAVRDALASGFLVQGARVREFEEAVAALVDIKHAIAVTNCTSALHLAMLALDVRPGDVCVVTAYSWVTTANVIELCGARPVFVDVDPETFNIDLDQLESVLENLMMRVTARRVRAVLPVHTFGQMVDMDRLNAICGRWSLPVVEDAACALGATFNGRQAGGCGTLGCFSFHPRKSITTGEGGIVATDDDALADRVRALRNHGIDPTARVQDFITPGFNTRLTEFQAALGMTQLRKLARITAARRAAAARYDELLEKGQLQSPHVMPGAGHVYQSYVTLLPPEAAPRRGELIGRAREAGVELQIGTIHIPLTTYYRRQYHYRAADFPVTDSIAERALTLPLHEHITIEQQRTVVDIVSRFLD